jgi:glycosyltransferase involved in cell wall biosynthesis
MAPVAQAPDTLRAHSVHLALSISGECLDRFEPILRHLVVGLVDHVARIHLVSSDPRMEKLALGPTQAVIRPFPRWPLSRRRVHHIVDAILPTSPTVVHAMSGPSYAASLALAEEFDADLVLQVTSLEDCAEMERYVAEHVGRVLCFTEPLAGVLSRQWKLPGELVEVVRPGIAVTPRPSCFARVDRVPTLVCTAPFTRTGGVDRVIEAAHITKKRGRRAMFFLLGHGPFESALRQRARDLGVLSSVTFAHPGGNPFDVISNADIFIHPSSSGGLYLEALQAMGLGLAVVAVPDPVADFLHSGQTALVCEGATASNVADGIDDLLTDRPLAQRLAASALEYARANHSMSAMADRTGAVYRQLLLARSTFALRE